MKNQPSNKMAESATSLSRSPASEMMISKYRVSEFQEEKVRNYNQLQSFYMPHMKRVYEEMKGQYPSIRPPEDLLVNSQLLSMKEADMARKIQTLHKDNEAKEGRIREMVKQIGSLVKRLKPFDPSISESSANFSEDNERTAKRYESLMKIKADETFFALKMKGIDLLKEFGLLKEEAEGIHHMQTDSEVFDFILNKLKLRIKDYKSRQKQSTELNYKEKAELSRYSERIQYLTETNEQLKNNESRLKEKVEEIKKEWSAACDRLIEKQKELEERDNEIFRLKRVIDDKESFIVITASKVSGDRDQIELKCKDLEQQLRDMRVLLSMYTLEKSELMATIDEKQSELEENRIRDKFNQEEYEKVLRDSARWKERYQWMERDRDTKSKFLEKENTRMDSELKITKVQLESQKIKYTELQTQTEELRLYNKRTRQDLTEKQQAFQKIQKKCSQLQEKLKEKVKELQQQYASKYRNLQKQRDNQILNEVINKEQQFSKAWLHLDHQWTVKIEELHKSYQTRLALQTSAHNRTLDQLAKLQEEYRELLEQVQRQKGSTSKILTLNTVSPKAIPKSIGSPRVGATSIVLPGQPFPNFTPNHLVHSPNIRINPQSNPLTPHTPTEPLSAMKNQPNQAVRYISRQSSMQGSVQDSQQK